jgi:hypothetical protein
MPPRAPLGDAIDCTNEVDRFMAKGCNCLTTGLRIEKLDLE